MVGIVSPREAWQALIEDEKAHLCDVRTEYEWDTIGVPDLSSIGKDVILIPWQPHPGRPHVNPNFVEDLGDAGLSPEHHIYFICRTGGRSLAAAQAALAAGFPHVYNVVDGFEGPPNETGARGTVAGWKAEGLPWRYR
jgi:rhodanese-related sulfurtransferase